MARIPLDPIGYSVNQSTGTIHTRYAGEHAGDAVRTRTVKGVETLLGEKKPSPCKTCYPAPVYQRAETQRAPQQRRSGIPT